MKLDFNRINELDRIHNISLGRNFFGHLLRPQSEKLRKNFLKDRDCLPGPSNVPPKKRKKMKVPGITSDSEDDVSPLDDMKSVTNCIVENTLNKLEVDDLNANKDDVIEFNLVPVEDIVENKEKTEEIETANKDNDNNNSDTAGNSATPISQNSPIVTCQEIDHENYNVCLAVDLSPIEQCHDLGSCTSVHNVPVSVTLLPNVPVPLFPHTPVPMLPNVPLPLPPPENLYPPPQDFQTSDESRDQDETNQDFSTACASREAIVDPNSVQDLLDDFDNNNSMEELRGFDILELGNVILVGIHPLPDNLDGQTSNGFPNWLLQILGTQVPITEGPMEGTLEEPHYYCQGDGLGVHPSMVAVEVDDEDDDHSSQSSNNTNTTDYAEIDPGMSSQDMSSLPEDSAADITTEIHDPVEEQEVGGSPSSVRIDTNFDAGPSSSDSGIGTSKGS